MSVNEALREHTTSIGFNLTLSKNMIDTLVVLDHFKGNFSEVMAWECGPGKQGSQFSRYYVPTFRSLERRGLVVAVYKYHRRGPRRGPKKGYRDIDNSLHKVTKAGRLVVGLLKEAGLYQERVSELGLGEVFTYKDGTTIPVVEKSAS